MPPARSGYSSSPGGYPPVPYQASPPPPASAGMSPSVERLSKVRSNLNALGDMLKADVHSKREFEENRIYEVRELTTKIEKHLTLEVKRRAESDKALQSLFEGRMQEMREALRREFTDRLTQQQMSVDVLTKKLVSVEKDLAMEREKNAQLLDKLDKGMSQEVRNIKATLDQDKVHRMEKEAQLLRKCAEDIYRLQERLDVEKHAREVAMEGFRDCIGGLGQDKTKDDDKFKSMVLNDLEQLKSAVRYEHEEREQAEEQMVQTMDQMVRQVQEALRVVSK
eukprot:TRINITY_DN11876_c0_g4_i1.p1 TRINITY_DN11876_c0_g4~~TRINITY_DN11876_c0_g4_i1.p1  ORF type:complete len:306 (+),score=146.82 TRINITY_DN11876_c0_g4_i1:80-919(+)